MDLSARLKEGKIDPVELMRIFKVFEGIQENEVEIKKIPTETRGHIIIYHTPKGNYCIKPLEKQREARNLVYLSSTPIVKDGTYPLIEVKNNLILEREINSPSIRQGVLGGSIDENVGAVIAEGFNLLHRYMIVYHEDIGDHWHYDGKLNITDFGEAVISNEKEEDFITLTDFLREHKMYKPEGFSQKALELFKENYIFKDDFLRYEQRYPERIKALR